MTDNEPWSDQWRRMAHIANERDAAANLMEQTRSAVLAQRKTQLGEMADNKAERIVKSSPEWEEYNKKMVKARQDANWAKIEAEWMKMKYYEHASDRADERTMAQL